MLEGKEVEGKLGTVGDYSVDVTPDIKVNAQLGADVEKDLIVAIPGGLSVKLHLSAELAADPVAIALHELAKSENPVAKFLASELGKLRAGEAPHPAVAVAAATPVAPSA